jgi:hypothetical protein
MHLKKIAVFFISSILSTWVVAGTGNHLIGWQKFENATPGDNNSGIDDTTPDTNSTFDPFSPTGNISASGHYLTGAINTSVSSGGYVGLGQNTNNTFLNDESFGKIASTGELIVDWPLADGSPGERLGPFGGTGNSSWKFRQLDGRFRGEFSITNNSSYFFRLEHIHFDARVGNADSPDDLKVIYLAENANLIKKSTGVEYSNFTGFWNSENASNEDFGPAPSELEVSRSVGAATSSAAYLAPGDTAAFRFVWEGYVTLGAQSQIDNVAFQGTFFETSDLLNIVDPVALESASVPVLPMLFQWVLAGLFAAISVFSIARKRSI